MEVPAEMRLVDLCAPAPLDGMAQDVNRTLVTVTRNLVKTTLNVSTSSKTSSVSAQVELMASVAKLPLSAALDSLALMEDSAGTLDQVSTALALLSLLALAANMNSMPVPTMFAKMVPPALMLVGPMSAGAHLAMLAETVRRMSMTVCPELALLLQPALI